MTPRKSNFWLLIPMMIAISLYLPSVMLPFFSDDIVHLRGVTTVSSEYIATHADLGTYYTNNYYRPVVNLIFRTQYVLGISPSAACWHFLMVLNHALNTALVGALAKYLRLSKFVVFMTILIFAVFPFNYQVVVWVLAWFHALVLTAILLACVAAVRYIEQPTRYDMLLAALAGSIAPFIHENGVMVSGFMLLILLFTGRFHPTRALPVLIPAGVAAVVYLYLRAKITGQDFPFVIFHAAYMIPLMAVMPHRRSVVIAYEDYFKKWLIGLMAVVLMAFILLTLRGKGIWTAYHLKTAYFVQGMSYPFQWINLPLSPEKQAWAGGLIMAGIWLAVFQFAPEKRRMMLVGAGWFGLASLLPVLFLNEGYVMASPRLFYVGAPGIALTIALLIDHLRGCSKIVGLAALIAVVFISVAYIRERQNLFLTLGQAYQDMMQQLPADENAEILVVNAPRWIASHDNPFPLDNMGAVFVPDYYPFEEFLLVNTERRYTHVTMVTDAETMYMPDRVTGIGERLDHASVMNLPHDFIYTFEIEE